MKKIVVFSSLAILLILFLLILPKYLVIEEILGLFFIPILLAIIVSTVLYFIIKGLKKVNYKNFIINALGIACIIQLLIGSLILWSASTRYFPREKVIGDIDYAIKVMEDVHPNLYDQISKESFIAKTDSLKNLLPLKVSDVELYKTLRKTFAQIGDGHTGAEWDFFFNRMALFFRKTLPYKIEVKDERLFVAKNYFYRNTIPIGSEIIMINGKPASQCLVEISELLSYESNPFRNSMIASPLFWGLWNNFEGFEITYQTLDKKIETIKSSGGIISKMVAFSESAGKDFSYKILPDNIGYIEFNSFSNLDKFESFLDSTFKSIQNNNVNDLIIDIRKNGGGNSSLGDELMQYISKTDFKMADSVTIKLSKDLIDKGYFNWLDSTKRIAGTIYTSYDTSRVKLRENPSRFKGNTYLLVGGPTFSSASMFASSFKCHNVGEIIGTETGGLTVCFGDVYVFQLPNTKFDMRVSYKKFFEACGVDNRRGVIPDYIVESSFEDDEKGIDRVLVFTIDLIKQKLNNQ